MNTNKKIRIHDQQCGSREDRESKPDYADLVTDYGSSTEYPFMNILNYGGYLCKIEIACAGFTTNEIDVSVKDNMLIVEAEICRATGSSDLQVVTRGISTKGFTREFRLARNTAVVAADYFDGILTITVEATEVVDRTIAIDDVSTTKCGVAGSTANY